MVRGAKGDLAVWQEFEGNADALRAAAALFRDSVSDPGIFMQMSKIDPADEGVDEGGLSYRRHRVYERDRALRQRKKAETLKLRGKLSCEACDLDFAENYGAVGQGYIEVHHNKPVSQMRPGEKTKLEDLALLCGNCHRIARRSKDVISVSEIRALIMQYII